jgi:hypothetical protein
VASTPQKDKARPAEVDCETDFSQDVTAAASEGEARSAEVEAQIVLPKEVAVVVSESEACPAMTVLEELPQQIIVAVVESEVHPAEVEVQAEPQRVTIAMLENEACPDVIEVQPEMPQEVTVAASESEGPADLEELTELPQEVTAALLESESSSEVELESRVRSDPSSSAELPADIHSTPAPADALIDAASLEVAALKKGALDHADDVHIEGHLERRGLRRWHMWWHDIYVELHGHNLIVYDEHFAEQERTFYEAARLSQAFCIQQTAALQWRIVTSNGFDANGELNFEWRAPDSEVADRWMRSLQIACSGEVEQLNSGA